MVRNGQSIFFFHLLESGLDHLGHKTLDIIQVRFGSGQKEFRDITPAPFSYAGLFVGSDVRNLFPQNPYFRPGEIKGAARHHKEISRGMAIVAQGNMLNQVAPSFHTALRGLGRGIGKATEKFKP